MIAQPPPFSIGAGQGVEEPVHREIAGLALCRFERAIAESHVGKPYVAAEIDAEDEVVADRSVAAQFAHDRSGGARDAESQLVKRPAKDAVHLVAPPTSMLLDDLVIDRRNVDLDAPPELDVEVLEGNGEKMRAMQPPQRLKIGP